MANDCLSKKYCHDTFCVVSNVRRMNCFYNGVKGREQATFKLGSPNLSVHLARFVRSINRILILPTRHASFLAPRGAGRHTPDPALALQAWVLHSRPRPYRVPAEPPPARLRQQAPQGRKIVFLGGPARRGRCAQPARQPRGGVRAASPASPGGPRPPTGRRASADCSAGFRERVPAPARPPRPRRPEGAPPPLPSRVCRVPRHPRSRARAGRPLRASVRPASAPRARRPPQQTGKGREPMAPRPAAPRGAAPRELVPSPAPAAAHRPPPSPPACLRQGAPARARSSPATRLGPQRTARTGCVHRK